MIPTISHSSPFPDHLEPGTLVRIDDGTDVYKWGITGVYDWSWKGEYCKRVSDIIESTWAADSTATRFGVGTGDLRLVAAARAGYKGKLMKLQARGRVTRMQESEIDEALAGKLGFGSVIECVLAARREGKVSMNAKPWNVTYWLIEGEFEGFEGVEVGRKFKELRERVMEACGA